MFELTGYKYPFCIQSCFSSGQSQPAENATTSFMLNGYKTPGKKLPGNKRPALLKHSVSSVYTALSARESNKKLCLLRTACRLKA